LEKGFSPYADNTALEKQLLAGLNNENKLQLIMIQQSLLTKFQRLLQQLLQRQFQLMQ